MAHQQSVHFSGEAPALRRGHRSDGEDAGGGGPHADGVLETQTCNERAIAFYRKCGFEIIGFDLYAYSNHDPEAHEVRLEMGKKLI